MKVKCFKKKKNQKNKKAKRRKKFLKKKIPNLKFLRKSNTRFIFGVKQV